MSSRMAWRSRGRGFQYPPIATKHFHHTKAVASSTLPCWGNSTSFRTSWPRAAFEMPRHPGYEADDFLAAAAAAEERRGGTTVIVSGDRDTFQLASEHTTILFPTRADEMTRIGPAEVRARYGVDPSQVPDFIALRGDPSDKRPGAPGVGSAGAAALLRKYGTLEATLMAGRCAAQADNLRLFRSITTMDAKAPLPSLRNQKPTWHKVARLARDWQLNQLAKRLEELVSHAM